MPRLVIHEPAVTGTLVYCTYTYETTFYSHRYDFGTIVPTDDASVTRLIRWLSIVSTLYLFNIEYFTELATEFPLDATEQSFFENLVYQGMAEFRQVNAVAMNTRTRLISLSTEIAAASGSNRELSGSLLLNGGGKDGCVSALMLERTNKNFDWFMLNGSVSQNSVAANSGRPTIYVKRLLDPQRFDGKYAGHHPTSACIAISSVLAAYLHGRAYVIASNEQSANEGNGTIDGVEVNHQYSKSLEFEQDFGALISSHGIPVQYFSLLRPLHELQIVKLMTQDTKYLSAFTSCNHGYKQGVWCMSCAKCAFIVFMFTALDPAAAKTIWGDELAIATPAFVPFIRELIDPDIQKPLECVGTIIECQLAAGMLLHGSLGPRLHPELRSALEHHALDPAQATNFIRTLSSQHAVPAEFAVVVEHMRTYLASAAH